MEIDPVANEYVTVDRVSLGECTRKEIREAITAGQLKAAIIPIGATEQHNEHLTLNVDIVISTYMSQQTAIRLYPKVTVVPGCPVGYSPYHMARKGTLTLQKKKTLQAYIADVMLSLRAHGIFTVLVINGHGGNGNLLLDVLPQWRSEWKMTLDQVNYWNAITDEQRAEILDGYRDLRDGKLDTIARQSALNHASEEETSLMLVADRHCVRPVTMDEYDAAGLDYAHNLSPEVSEIMKAHMAGGWPAGGSDPENPRDRARQENALLASAEKGRQLLAHYIPFLVKRMESMMAATEAERC